jgi:hypothetical protein
MQPVRADKSLQETLGWALDRMKDKGFAVRSRVNLTVDPKLAIMGYAKKEGGAHRIVISEWALDSEMLGGLLMHELAHIYFTEKGARSHDGQAVEDILESMRENEGLSARETENLIDAFNHLQNIIVDDVVFAVMDDKEHETAKRFFSEWVSERPTGDPVADAASLCRNAFAIASLNRRGMNDPEGEMSMRSRSFVDSLGGSGEGEFRWLESFLEKANAEWDDGEFDVAIREYFERLLYLMRATSSLRDLR